ncbi:MAG: hypothetical protein PHQ35_08450 [Phycisphaerae bacterium]|nr:hypothetical protein [Phycisphaerae bacterium]MDD5381519.1 hypothetical protein [Phycisphaerae bacterium]
MIKTLRITSIIAVVLAVFLFVLPAAFGFRGDKQTEQFLKSAGVIEKFKEARGDKIEDGRREISPLVKQAEAFALYLNPPPKPKPTPSTTEAKRQPRPAGPVAAKFRLIGTSRHVLQPELSLALIDEPGKGLYWVRQSSQIGHLVVEQIKDGLIVVRDGKNTFELVAERPAQRSLLKASTSFDGRITGDNPETGLEVQINAKETEAVEREISNAGRARQKAVPANVEAEEIAAAKRETVSDLENMRISTKEARGLGRLGRRLKNVQQEPDRAGNSSAERDANLNEPALNDANITGQG